LSLSHHPFCQDEGRDAVFLLIDGCHLAVVRGIHPAPQLLGRSACKSLFVIAL